MCTMPVVEWAGNIWLDGSVLLAQQKDGTDVRPPNRVSHALQRSILGTTTPSHDRLHLKTPEISSGLFLAAGASEHEDNWS